jgi:hypothetical protein
MSFTLAAATSATGLSKAAILRAIRDGTISGTRDKRGVWYVEPGDLHRLQPPVAPHDAAQHNSQSDIDALGAQIEALLRQAGQLLRQQLDEVRRDPSHDQRLQLADQDERSS